MNKVEVKVFNNGKHKLPEYESKFAAGFDIRSNFTEKNNTIEFLGSDGFTFNNETKELTLFAKGGRVLIPTGLYVAIPDGYELQIRPRSGLSLKKGISIVNSPGTIDSDYRGEIGLILINTDPHNDFIIKDGERLAQGVLNQVSQVKWSNMSSIEELGDTVRGQGGFGHTGK
jgi:dUTP pyrophosphatase